MTKDTRTVEPEPTDDVDVPTGLNFIEESIAPEHFNVLLYGPPGSGKSTAAATAPGPILWLNAEGGNALAFARKVARERGTSIFEVRIDAKNRTPGVKQTLDEAYLHVKNGRAPEPQTVVVDTVGKLREALAEQIAGKGHPTIQQWGDISQALGGFVKALRDLPVNLILLAHEDVSDDADAGRIVRPMIGGKQTELIPGEVDVVAYCGAVRGDDGTVRYVAQLVESKGRRAKDRSGGLGNTRDLDLSEWLSTFRSALGAEPVPWEEKADGEPQETLA